ncbi:glutamate--tRNA ligase [bacterium]|nr:glutamate--tRNA ligase [bacterium]
MENSQKLRVRFAPSPTGYLHVGGARTALYNYLLAKKHGGVFILRIEDTDLERSTPESIQAIMDGMNWLDLKWDEGPFYQTKRFDLYKEYIQKLVDAKKAYPCFCTPEELDAKRKIAQDNKQKPMYDRTCLKLSDAEVAAKKDAGLKYCIRFKSPDDGETVINDVIKGRVVVANKELDDLVIARTDGSPTYNFTVVVDDVTMGITHVIRGDDHLNNTPRQLQMYEALGFPVPLFAHVPMILGADKKRLSKRHGATSVMAYREMGYLPHALLNYLVRLGWSYKDQEVFTREELIEKFSLESVSGSAGVFNPEKLLWLNGLYIREAKAEDLLSEVEYQLSLKGITSVDKNLLLQTIKASQEKVKTLTEMAELIDFFFIKITPDQALLDKTFSPDAKKALGLVSQALQGLTDWTSNGIHALFEKLVADTGLGLGKLASPVRVALSGKKISPGIYDMLRILGRDESLKRITPYL